MTACSAVRSDFSAAAPHAHMSDSSKAGRDTTFFLEQIDIDVRRDGHLTLGQRPEHGGLAGTVAANETVAATDGELDGRVLDQLLAVGLQRETLNLDVQRCQ